MLPEVHLDYCCIKEEATEKTSPVLVGKVRPSNMLIAHAVECKGTAIYRLTAQLCRDIRKAGIRGQ